jgi:DNA modification methylase
MSQQELGIESKTTNNTVGEYKFEPIKGYPMLNWRGKRPFTSTHFYPAQLREAHGEEINGWRNKLYWGDNLQVLSHLLKEFRGKINLVYIDPPFDSKADYKKNISLKGKNVSGDFTSFEEKQYSDIWANDEYLQFIYERIVLVRELLSDDGSIYVHLDEKKSHYVKLMLDEIFGASNFRREIIWDITVLSGFKVQAMNWIRGHDSIFYYSKSDKPKFIKLRQPHVQKYIDMFNQIDENGEKYLVAHGSKRHLKDVIDKGKPFGDVWDDITSYHIFRKMIDDVRTIDELYKLLKETKTIQQYSSVWDDIMSFQQQPTAAENAGYPTQKPESLLERIIKSSTEEGDLVLDCFMGSGTTQAVAMKLGRRFIGADINLGAIQTTTKRLVSVSKELSQQPFDEIGIKYTGFEVYNVNYYDVFRNPAEAKDLLLDALEIQKLEMSSVYDGEKDGRMVKIMPVTRITTRADLTELIAGFDYKAFERRQSEKPNQPVEKIWLVCMGHEPDLKAHLQKEVPFKLDVEIVDILRNKSKLEFKRDSEAQVVIKGRNLVIERFYPMNLLQKLSMQKEAVSDWKELVESVMIDWNYDGAILQPSIVDIPDKNDMVIGSYKVPADAGTIRVKITDLLSESLEVELANG